MIKGLILGVILVLVGLIAILVEARGFLLVIPVTLMCLGFGLIIGLPIKEYMDNKNKDD